MSGHEPVRTCTGCGARAPRRALVRFVASGGRLALDAPGRAPGRGAYLHERAECWSAFVRRRGPVRSLRFTPPMSERESLIATLAARIAPGVER